MEKQLQALMQRRTAERLATRVLPERSIEFRQERQQTPTPERVQSSPVRIATENEHKLMPVKAVPSVGPGFTSKTTVRETAARAAMEKNGAAIFAQGMNKIDPLERLLAKQRQERAMQQNPNRPAVKLIQDRTQGMER